MRERERAREKERPIDYTKKLILALFYILEESFINNTICIYCDCFKKIFRLLISNDRNNFDF